MIYFFGFWPFLIPLLIFVFAFRVLPRLFNGLFREIDGRNGPHHRSVSSRRRRPDGAGAIADTRPPSIEAIVFDLAYRRKGRITLSDIIIATGAGMKEAEELIHRMIDGTRVTMEVDDRGLVVYEFPEIIARFEDDSKA